MAAVPRRFASLLLLLPGAALGLRDDPELEALVERVHAERDRVDLAVLEEIGSRADRDAFDALKRCVDRLRSRAALDAACEAFRHLRSTELEGRAVAYLASEVDSERPPLRRAAVRGLVRFGDPARAALEHVARSSRHPTLRALAVGGLVPALRASRSEDALELLLDAYRVPESGPERLAIAALCDLASPEALVHFAWRLRDPAYPGDMQLVLVRALAGMRIDGVDGILVGLLGGAASPPADGPVVREAIEALAAREHHQHRALLEELERSPDASVRRDALVAQGPLQDDAGAWVRRLFALSRGADPALRAGAAIACGRVDSAAARETLYGLLRDRAEPVRFEAYCAVGDLRRKESIPRLIDCLETEEPHLRWSPHFELRMLTGEDHGLSADRWRHWWDDARADFAVPSYEEALRRERERRDRTFHLRTRATFYGLAWGGEPACLVVDTSISMGAAAAGGATRQRVAQRELVQLLGRVPLGQRMNLVFFAHDVHPFARRMFELDEDTRREALRFVWDQPLLGGTSIWDALDFALEDPDVEAIYLLTDGEPTSGSITTEAGILRAVREQRELREFEVSCVDVGGEGRKLLEGLVEATGGRLVETD